MEKQIVIVGAGPAGLIAAERLAQAGHSVAIYERKASPARKFLMAGRGGLNLTHSEDIEDFIARYGVASGRMGAMVRDFTPLDLRAWCEGLGEETFVGSSGRVFPKSFKASPLLRAWLRRLGMLGVTLYAGKTWEGWNKDGEPVFNGEAVKSDAVLLALGGASWPGLGSDGGWVPLLKKRGVMVNDLRPANCGFICAWSDIFIKKFAGQPLKAIAVTHAGKTGRGDMMIDRNGIEGGAVYALSSDIRGTIEEEGSATIHIDLRPDIRAEEIVKKLARSREGKSLSNYLRVALNLSPVEINLLRETNTEPSSIKSIPLICTKPFPIDRAISSAGGIALDAVNDDLMLKALPGVFVAGEMLDWEAPTGGYLLQGCFASGVRAACGLARYLAEK